MTNMCDPARERFLTALVSIGELVTVGAAEVGIGVLDPAERVVDAAVVLPVEAGSLWAGLSSLGSNFRLLCIA